MTRTIQWSNVQDVTSWDVDPTVGCTSKPKVPPYFLNTVCHLVLHRSQKPMDRNLILWRIGKALGMVQ